MNLRLISALAAIALCLVPALASAAPTLKAEIAVTADIVTVSDMFEDAGSLAAEPLFRAPPLGTSGMVSIDEVTAAAERLGLIDFTPGGIAQVRVSRLGVSVDETMLVQLIVDDLRRRGILSAGMGAEPLFSQPVRPFLLDAVAEPVRLVNLRYLPGSGAFTARFLLAGREAPLDLTGSLEITVDVPHLVTSLRSGAILTPGDVALKSVPQRFAEGSGMLSLDDVIGKQLQRSSRAGVMLKSSDLGEPQLILRNEAVTLYYRQGPLTLTVKGQALNNAVAGAPVTVLNTMSNRVMTGIALARGAVEIRSANSLSLAGLE